MAGRLPACIIDNGTGSVVQITFYIFCLFIEVTDKYGCLIISRCNLTHFNRTFFVRYTKIGYAGNTEPQFIIPSGLLTLEVSALLKDYLDNDGFDSWVPCFFSFTFSFVRYPH